MSMAHQQASPPQPPQQPVAAAAASGSSGGGGPPRAAEYSAAISILSELTMSQACALLLSDADYYRKDNKPSDSPPIQTTDKKRLLSLFRRCKTASSVIADWENSAKPTTTAPTIPSKPTPNLFPKPKPRKIPPRSKLMQPPVPRSEKRPRVTPPPAPPPLKAPPPAALNFLAALNNQTPQRPAVSSSNPNTPPASPIPPANTPPPSPGAKKEKKRAASPLPPLPVLGKRPKRALPKANPLPPPPPVDVPQLNAREWFEIGDEVLVKTEGSKFKAVVRGVKKDASPVTYKVQFEDGEVRGGIPADDVLELDE